MEYENAHVTLFEVSWEVCNKVGGIYSVVSSKALQAVEKFGDNYYLIGPDLKNNAEFEETDEPCWEVLRTAMGVRNIKCRFGRWTIPGNPKVILVTFAQRFNQDQLLYEMWNRYGVDSLSGGWDYIEPVMFSSTCAEVIDATYQTLVQPLDGKAVAHFHEWMCGAGLLAIKKLAPEIATVFTTHATVVGRSMAGSGVDIYRQMKHISPAQEAAAHNVTAKSSLESISAREADCFTTVSGITADEAEAFLGRTADVLTLNGLDMRVIPDYSTDRAAAVSFRQKLMDKSKRFLRKDMPDNTLVCVISGRYEFHNKGIDTFLEALAGVEQAIKQTDIRILAICAVMGGHTGVNHAAVNGEPDGPADQGMPRISTHHVYDQPNDPILNSCKRLGLVNCDENHVQVIFIPAMLNGHDGFLDMTYYELLAASDLGVFPSWYEPWGYTPQESVAHSVPTVTTDLSGFGIWARDWMKEHSTQGGVTILQRRQTSYEATVAGLKQSLLNFAGLSEEERDAQRRFSRNLAMHCSWEGFFPLYTQAYTLALGKSGERNSTAGEDIERRREVLTRVLSSTASTSPNLHSLTAIAELPKDISRLREVAYNLWWCWQPDAWKLFSMLNPQVWEKSDHNPVRVVEEANPEHLQRLAKDFDFCATYQRLMLSYETYMREEPKSFGPVLNKDRPIAYFSTEYGLHESLPIYSGGLGVLSGDHLKSASDLNIPLVAVGLLYRNGYFRQQIDRDARQVPLYPENNFAELPIERVQEQDGSPVYMQFELPGRQLFVQIWRVKVGRISLYLMDTDIPMNTPDDRKITARLYEADRDYRLRQEILLGMGGVRMLGRLGIIPSVYHMNEGHSAFMVLERIRVAMSTRGMSLEEAKEMVRANTIFTTHTPVDAGNERFSEDQMQRYFTDYAASIGLSFQDFMKLGRLAGDERHVFEMTVLALSMSYKANGVSRLHGVVSRYMWRDGWKGVPVSEVPIGYVTNGIHVPSYVGPYMRPILEKELGPNWLELKAGAPEWNQVDRIPDDVMWRARQEQKNILLQYIRQNLPVFIRKFDLSRSDQKKMLEGLNPASLVIGFARRFAPYKRATLLFADPDRLARILSDPNRPVVLVFSGKAHPADEEGIKLIQAVINYCRDTRFLGRIFFIEDYSLAVSRLMVQGSDVWLNNPRRPYEASGTSGQKVLVNGGLNLSISDGWWCEGQGDRNGWTIGPMVSDELPTALQSDYADAESLYTLLEDSVVPLYYDSRDSTNVPRDWMRYSKQSLKTLTAQFSSDRMVGDYVDQYYLPAAARFAEVTRDNLKLTRELTAWKAEVPARFATLRMGVVQLNGIEGDQLVCGQPLTVQININLGAMRVDEILVQLVIGPSRGDDFAAEPECIRLAPGRRVGENSEVTFTGTFVATRNGRYTYGIRVMPVTEGLDSPLATGLLLWA